MKVVGAFEAKNKLGQLLDPVEQGEAVYDHPARQRRRPTCPGALETRAR